ncbi:hemicentin-1 [Drosophila ficusphila]|uniref:hemicentin-1 n=1 Tax=Drosophila ficusphila TaxID=30025 RepID=UPI0007E5FF2C|nr:hemicentin-1 [Drosophila ficusphila]
MWTTDCPKALKAICLVPLWLVLLLDCGMVGGEVPPHYWETPYSQPYFDNSSRREVTATVGQAALLHCRVRNLGDRAVSWIRKRDLHILTVGILTYTNDQRFQSLHSEGSDEWTLRISSPQPRDSGTYECQVSTEPKISQGFRLNVVVSRAKILGNAELFIKSGSDINLTCLAMQSPVPPSFIYWYKGKRVMNYLQRGGINVITERSTRTSKLLIAKATPADSGNYTCSPSSSDSASVVVHVINGEHPAAMQHGNSSASCLRLLPVPFVLATRLSMAVAALAWNSNFNCNFNLNGNWNWSPDWRWHWNVNRNWSWKWGNLLASLIGLWTWS